MSEFEIKTFDSSYEKQVIDLWKEGTLGVAEKVSSFTLFKQTWLWRLIPLFFSIIRFYNTSAITAIIYFIYCYYYSQKVKKHIEKYVETQDDMKSSETIIQNYLTSERNHFWILTKGDELYGCIAVKEKDEKTAELLRMSISKKFQRQGFGKKLYSTLEKFCLEKNYGTIYLETTTLQKEAIKFYKKLGFYVVDVYQKERHFPIGKLEKYLKIKTSI